MKRITLFTLAVVVFCACNKDNDFIVEQPMQVGVSLDYVFSESGSMSRASNSIYDNFYNKYIKTKTLAPSTYELSFVKSDGSDSVYVKGCWRDKDIVTLTEGSYIVKGTSHPMYSNIQGKSSYIAQDTVSILFNETVVITKDMATIRLSAKYDCFLLMFDNANTTDIRYGTFSPIVKAFKSDNMYYLFFKGMNIIKDLSDYPLYCTRKNSEVSEIWLSTFNFQKGNYYYFKDYNGVYDIPPMNEGGAN